MFNVKLAPSLHIDLLLSLEGIQSEREELAEAILHPVKKTRTYVMLSLVTEDVFLLHDLVYHRLDIWKEWSQQDGEGRNELRAAANLLPKLWQMMDEATV